MGRASTTEPSPDGVHLSIIAGDGARKGNPLGLLRGPGPAFTQNARELGFFASPPDRRAAIDLSQHDRCRSLVAASNPVTGSRPYYPGRARVRRANGSPSSEDFTWIEPYEAYAERKEQSHA